MLGGQRATVVDWFGVDAGDDGERMWQVGERYATVVEQSRLEAGGCR